ncbi:MAG TPA: outer membrane beta-barrel protein [Candidatus Krumholzibacteria bacterium]|nr:outer membrane beta-barrel protein [Candidatus Krumholzibacteria bacterium]HPD71925.1 outer membrane beta-barrel protein [Candidatus Krumholzibacteria bacterium]HRY41142.1 outer membrane beta-barrel protein [Candidatus Krumholzibacteria bacterium]
MRRLSILAAVCLFAGGAASATSRELVLHAGLTSATVHQDDLYSDAREGLALGAGARVPLGDDFSLQPEAWYLRKGFEGGTLWESIDLDGRRHVLSFPVLVSYWLTAERLDSRVFAGLAADILLKAEIRELGAESWADVTDHDETLSWSLVVGGGARLGRVDLEVRYQHGFTRLTRFAYPEFDDLISQMQERASAFDRTWILTAGWWF